MDQTLAVSAEDAQLALDAEDARESSVRREHSSILQSLFAQHHVRLVNFLSRRLGGDRAQAVDLAQETYTRIAA